MSAQSHRAPPQAWLPLRSAVLGILICLASPPAHAQQDGVEPLQCGVVSGQVTCAIDARDGFDDQIRELLDNGFTNNLVYRLTLYRVDSTEPVASAGADFAQVFRLYTEVYYISRGGIEGYTAHYDWPGAVAGLSRFLLPVAAVDTLEEGRYLADLTLEVNPLGEEDLSQARGWIDRARGGYAVLGGRGTGWRSFISFFSDDDETTAQAVRRFRSPAFEVTREP